MKIKRLKKNNLLVILSQGETKQLGFQPEFSCENLRTKAIAARIYKAICEYTKLPVIFGKMHIKISFYENETILLFSPVLKYHIRGYCKDMIFSFKTADALIGFLKTFSKKCENIVSCLYNYRSNYYLITVVPFSARHSFLRKVLEFADTYEKSSAMHRKISEHGELIFYNKDLSSIQI